MSTQLFFRAGSNGLSSSKLFMSTTRGIMSCPLTTNTTGSGTNISVTDVPGGSIQKLMFQLSGSGSISGNMTASVYGLESNIAANAGLGILVELVDTDGATVVGTILSDRTVPSTITEYGTTDGVKTLASVAVTTTAYTDGQFVSVTLKVRNVGTMGASRTVTNFINGVSGTDDSSITFATPTLTQKAFPFPYVVAGGSDSQGNTGPTMSPGTPAGVTGAGMLEVAIMQVVYLTTTAPAAGCITPPSGWVEDTSQAVVAGSSGNWQYQGVFYHYSTGAETAGTAVNFTANNVAGTGLAFYDAGIGLIGGYTGTSGSPFVDTPQSKHSAVASVTMDSFTPGGSNSLLLAFSSPDTSIMQATPGWEPYVGGGDLFSWSAQRTATAITPTFTLASGSGINTQIWAIRNPSLAPADTDNFFPFF